MFLSILQQVNKLQKEIDAEADRQLRLAQEVQTAKRPREKAALQDRLTRSEERMQTLAMLMLHYCAGIQHVNETSQAQTPEANTSNSIPVPKVATKPQANGHWQWLGTYACIALVTWYAWNLLEWSPKVIHGISERRWFSVRQKNWGRGFSHVKAYGDVLPRWVTFSPKIP